MSKNTDIVGKILKEQTELRRKSTIELSPEVIDRLVRDPFGSTSPLQFKKMDNDDYGKIPVLNSVKCLAEMIEQSGGLKLTQTGHLQRKVIMELHQHRFFPKTSDFEITDYKKSVNENDLPKVSLSRFLLELSGLTRKSKGKLLLTRKWQQVKQDNDKLLRLVFDSFTQKLNWAYFDRHPSGSVGQFGVGVSLALVSKFGCQRLSGEMYGEAYYNVFPWLLEDFVGSSVRTMEEYAFSCYSLRTFERFLEYFGLVTVYRDKKDYFKAVDIEKSDLFDKFIACSL